MSSTPGRASKAKASPGERRGDQRVEPVVGSTRRNLANAALQRFLLTSFRLVAATRILDTRPGRRIFGRLYHAYKDHLEAGPIGVLERWVEPGKTVIDIGANIGYFTLRFASWVRDGGMVIAIEPEPGNYSELLRAVARAGRAECVEACRLAIADSVGTGFLELHGWHPGNHRLGTRGVQVEVTTLDELLRARGWPPVSLVKIDVQGGEARVLAGATATLERLRPALFIEIDDRALRGSGSDALSLLQTCRDRGYAIHHLDAGDISPPLTCSEALASIGPRGYRDFLFLSPAHAGRIPSA